MPYKSNYLDTLRATLRHRALADMPIMAKIAYLRRRNRAGARYDEARWSEAVGLIAKRRRQA